MRVENVLFRIEMRKRLCSLVPPALRCSTWSLASLTRHLDDCLTYCFPRIDELSHKIHGISGKKDSFVVFFVSYRIVVDLFSKVDIVGMQRAEFTEAEDVDELVTENLDVNSAKG